MELKMKSLIETILQAIVDAGYLFSIDNGTGNNCIIVSPTNDTSKGFGKDEYLGVHAVDDCYIRVWGIHPDGGYEDHSEKGWIRWTNWNTGIEKVIDYSLGLDHLIGLNSVCEKWETDFDKFIREF